MSDGLGYFLAACVPAVASGIAWTIKLLSKFGKENKKDHDKVMEEILELNKSVKKVGKKLDKHIDWHTYEK